MEIWTWEMALKLAEITILLVSAAAGIFLLFRRIRCPKLLNQALAGVLLAICTILISGISVDNDIGSQANPRVIGPLAGGLFFGPLSGITAGIILGADRLIASIDPETGEVLAVSSAFTVFCVGCVAAALNQWVFHGRKPSVSASVLIGALAATIRLYAVLIIENLSVYYANMLLIRNGLPLTASAAFGTGMCSIVFMWISGEKPGLYRYKHIRNMPIALRFQRRLVGVIILLVTFNAGISWIHETRSIRESALDEMAITASTAIGYYEKTGDTEAMEDYLTKMPFDDMWYMIMDKNGPDKIIFFGEVIPAEPEDVRRMELHAGETDYTESFAALDDEKVLVFQLDMDSRICFLIMRPESIIYMDRTVMMYEGIMSDILLFATLYIMIVFLTDKLVVRNLQGVNGSLARITGGKLTETVDARASCEFSELSDSINTTVTALRGYIDAAEKRMEQELKMAADIQNAALPKNFNVPSEHIELYALMTPARQVGGDFYDFFSIGPEQSCFVIADVSGKGIPAAMFMMRAKTAIKYYARSGNGPAEVLSQVNNTLCEDNDKEMFVTVWLGILEMKTGIMRCCSAGHEYPVLMRAGENYELLKTVHGMMLGTFEHISMKEYELQLNPGDRVFVYTDGVPEAVNEKAEQYGSKRMTRTLTALKELPQEQLLKGMLADIREFAGEAEQFDDITMMGFTYR